MHRPTLIRRLTLTVVALAGALSLAGLALGTPTPSVVPGAIAVPAGNELFLIGHAVGVQIYSCNASAGGFGWGFVAPRANVYAHNGRLLMTHFAGPRWRARDGSTVLGSRVDGVTVDPGAIPWLLLSASTEGPHGRLLAGTTFIQRIATTGGLAPAPETCNEHTVGATEDVPYTADYTFWRAAGAA